MAYLRIEAIYFNIFVYCFKNDRLVWLFYLLQIYVTSSMLVFMYVYRRVLFSKTILAWENYTISLERSVGLETDSFLFNEYIFHYYIDLFLGHYMYRHRHSNKI